MIKTELQTIPEIVHAAIDKMLTDMAQTNINGASEQMEVDLNGQGFRIALIIAVVPIVTPTVDPRVACAELN